MIRHFTTLSLLALVASCTSQTTPAPKPAYDSSRNPDLLAPDLYPGGAVASKEPVVRYGRYTLVSTLPESGQRDLMAQIIDVSIPAHMKPNLRDAMQYVMDRSGYSLCSADSGHVNILYTRQLPAAQYKLGPMTLRNTLQVLAGPAWQVKVDEVNRQVCYVLRPGYQLPDSTRSALTQVAQANPPTSVQSVPASAASSSAASKVLVTTAPPSVPVTGTVSLPALDQPKSVPLLNSPPPTSAASTTKPVTAPSAVTTPPKPAATVVAIPTPLAQTWAASTGSTLRQTVEGWAATANWRLIWKVEDLDYPIDAPLRFEGSFQEAIKQIFPLYDAAPRSFVVDGSSSQRLIYIAERKP